MKAKNLRCRVVLAKIEEQEIPLFDEALNLQARFLGVFLACLQRRVVSGGNYAHQVS